MIQMTPKTPSLSGRVYRLLLYAYPAPFRREYGRPMAQLFRDEARRVIHVGGLSGLIGFWLLTLIDLVKSALAEHIWEIFHMPLEKLTRWSGLAAAIGGPLFVATWTSHAFWRFVASTGIPEGDYLHPLLAETGLVLMAIGLVGLYRRLPANLHRVNLFALALSLVATLGLMVGTLGLVISLPESVEALAWFGFLALLFGVAIMGTSAISGKSLGKLSFIPVALVISAVAFILTAESSDQLALAFVTLYDICWVLLGIGLWFAPEEVPSPALSA